MLIDRDGLVLGILTAERLTFTSPADLMVADGQWIFFNPEV
jgi:hypothetical protein